ncbi:MAG TPA: ABC transporter permease, partial [Streptosporangiaceae bacterium]|nr:ABC transporter permease [Streptosporangiaceae bacterium]
MTTATLGGPEAVAPSPRLSARAGLRNSFTLTWRSVLKIRTNAEDLLGLSLQPIMFLLLFTYVFGGAIAHGNVHAYLQYVLPGILVQTVLFATLGTGLMLNQDISAGIFDRFRSLPIARWAPLAGAILGDVARYVISVVVTLGFGMVLGFRPTSVIGTIAGCALVLLFALAMCWLSALIGLVVKSPQGVQVFGFTAMFPIVFASGVLVPVQTMPGWLQAFAKANPMTLLAEASRGLMTGVGAIAVPTLWSLLWALGFFVVFAPLAVRAYRRKA